jgi:hypothetical protein
MKQTFVLLWALIGLALLLLEGYALGRNEPGLTLSALMRLIRFNTVGRFILLPLWTWLTMHWIMAPQWLGTKPDWRSLVSIAIGLAWAAWETWR